MTTIRPLTGGGAVELTGAALERVVSDELRACEALLMRQSARVRAPESCVVT